MLAETNGAPVALLEVNIPLREDGTAPLAGLAQFLMNGTSIAREYAELDRHLALQSALAFMAGGSILAAGLALAFRRVQRANRLLAERTSSLLQANRELALAAKTSAVGAVTSHLIHGLRNPLTGLHSFVQDRAVAPGNGEEGDWRLAVATTERMQSLINRVVRVLQEEPAATRYEVTLAELVEMLSRKLQPAAAAAGVDFQTGVAPAGALSNHEADLVLLILENLVQNAIEATPAGKAVRLAVGTEGDRVVMEVADEGPGLPPEMQARLFTPCASHKKGGSGIGLAISQQLAKHLGAELGLKHSSSKGCTFRLALPWPGSPAERLCRSGARQQRGPHCEGPIGFKMTLLPVMRLLELRTTALRAALFLAGALLTASQASGMTWRWSNPTPHGNDIFAMAWNGYLSVQVSDHGQVYTGTDFLGWVPQNSGTTNDLQGGDVLRQPHHHHWRQRHGRVF